ncbi:MAG: NAD(P)-dependent alcohol dehydrogenase [Steroidobacteraceae bacterium]
MNATKSPRRPLWKRWWIRIVVILLAAIGAGLWYISPEPLPPPKGSGEPMQAIVYDEYGAPDVLRLAQVERPLPGDNQLLIRIRAAAANPLDWHYMRGTPYLMRMESGYRRPVDPRLGVDVSGIVEAVGKAVTQFKPGDAVFGTANGAFAEYAITAARRVVLKPANLTFQQAAAVPVAALTALQALRDKGQIQPGQKVLINGASGGVGTFAVQIAKTMGAEVTGVCSTRNVELVRSLGADHVIDYTQQDFTEGNERYDLIIDNVFNRSLSEYRRVLGPTGRYVLIGGGGPEDNKWLGPLGALARMWLVSLFVDQELGFMLSATRQDDLRELAALMEAGKIRPVIDRSYALRDVPAALRYLETGRARGKVVIMMEDAG